VYITTSSSPWSLYFAALSEEQNSSPPSMTLLYPATAIAFASSVHSSTFRAVSHHYSSCGSFSCRIVGLQPT
jgi:hypothetical protein